MRENSIGPAGADELGKLLRENTGIQTLYVDRNVLGDAGGW